MLTGHNSEVQYGGRTYHVQTEDKGQDNPVIETLVYSKGEIIDSMRSSYGDLAERDFDQQELLRRLEEQHRRCLREIRSGRYVSDATRPLDPNPPVEKTLDELVLEALEASGEAARLKLELVTEVPFFEGTSVIVDLVARMGDEGYPAGGAAVRADLLARSGRPVPLFEGKSGEDGRLTLVLDVPDLGGAEASVIITAESEEATARLSRPVVRI